ASACKDAKITQVVFDRNGYPYIGRVAAVADGARAGGIEL
ncbi:MAG: 50S ribosomal protein L18, partial [Myxococcota bacterium]|nr:50S ribosomal protein L18 [Myxococcota bacterium]